MSCHWSHVGLGVSDLQRSRRFYEQVLGFVHDTTIEVEGPYIAGMMRLPQPARVRVAMMVKDGFTLELMQILEPGMRAFRERVLNEPGLTHLNIRCADVPAIRDRVETFGGTVLWETAQPRLEGSMASVSEAVYVRDPDGQLIELIPETEAPGGWRPFHLRGG